MNNQAVNNFLIQQQQQQIQQQQQQLQQQQQQQQQQRQANEVQEQAYRLVSAVPERPHHVLKFSGSRNKVDLNSFTKPIKLVRDIPQSYLDRHNYRNKNNPNNNQEESSSSKISANGNDATQENAATNDTQNKLDTSKIAPFGHAQKNKQNLFKKRTKQVYLGADDSSRDKTIQEIKKEKEAERYPWLLTDFDNNITNTYGGLLEGGQHANYVLFMFSDDGFKVIPAAKWYKFTPKLTYQTLTIEEAETKLAKTKIEQDRWMMRRKNKPEEEEAKKKDPEEENVGDFKPSEFKITDRDDLKQEMEDDDDQPKRKSFNVDEEDLDFDEEFQDDEEPLFGIDNDEETRESEKKQSEQIKSLTRKDDEFFEDEDESENEDETKLTSAGKDLKKIVKRIEKSIVFDSDEEKNPYASSESEDTSDSEAEDQNENPEGQNEENKANPKSNINSAASTPNPHKSEKKKDGEHKKHKHQTKDGLTKVKKESGLKSKGESKSKNLSKKRLNDEASSPKKESVKKIKIKKEDGTIAGVDAKKHKHDMLKKAKHKEHPPNVAVKEEKPNNNNNIPAKVNKKVPSSNTEQKSDITEIELVHIIRKLQPIKTRDLIPKLQPTILKRNPMNKLDLPKMLARLVKKNEDGTIELRQRIMEQYKNK